MPNPSPRPAVVTTNAQNVNIECREPATGARLGRVPVDPPERVRSIVDRARDAQLMWAKSSFSDRRKLLSLITEHILEHADEICEVIVRDAGKTRENAVMGEIWPVCEKIRWTIANGETHLRPETRSSGLFLHKKATVLYQPLGVVGVICPWNYPLQNVLGPTVAALFAGNSVVAKVSEQVAWSADRIQRIFDEAFERLGYSTDTVRLINGYGETGAALVRSGVDKIIFTGSVPNGRRIIESSAENITPVTLELGGKDVFIVCEDAHLEQAVHAALTGVFIAAGQNCMAAERILVHRSIYSRFIEEFVQRVKSLRYGVPSTRGEIDPVDMGAIVSPAQMEVIENLVGRATQEGARLLTGGNRAASGGQIFEPTVLVDVRPDMEIAREELFGPVAVVMPYDDDEEAIEIANGTRFGLGSSVMTRSRTRGRKFAERLRTGSTCINDFGFTYMAQDLPFGGVDASGFGRLNGREGLRACTNRKSILEDRWPLHMPTKLYPVETKVYPLVRGTLRALYHPRMTKRARALLEIARDLGRREHE